MAQLVEERAVTAIKYAIVLDNPVEDAFLAELVKIVDPSRIISGIGERPAISHWKNFGLRAFTSGSVSIAPRVSAERRVTWPLNPVRVLHDGVKLTGIAARGPVLPLLSNLDRASKDRVSPVAAALLALNVQVSVGKPA